MTTHWIRSAWPVTFWLALACGGDDGGDSQTGGDLGGGILGGGAGSPSVASDLACELGELRVQGTLDGATVDERAASTTHSFLNKISDEPGHLEVSAGELSLQLFFDRLLPDGASTSARGSFSSADVDAGNCETGESSGALTLDADGGGARFLLTELHASPYCTGAPLSGRLEGCFKYPDTGF